MPFIVDQSICWTVWSGIFCSLQTVVKKDKDDVEGVLYALYPEFKKHINKANFANLVSISAAITLNDKKLTGIFCTRVSFTYPTNIKMNKINQLINILTVWHPIIGCSDTTGRGNIRGPLRPDS